MARGVRPPAEGALREAFGERLRVGEPLARYTSARIGGPADLFVTARSVNDLRMAARLAWELGLPLTILGGGSNVLVADAGARGLVVHNRAERVHFEGVRVVAESGASLTGLVRRCIGRGLAGLEWAVGVPGTVGGALVGNAGAHGGDMAGCVEWAEILSPDGEQRWNNADLGFGYRTSSLKRTGAKSAILSVGFRLAHGDPHELRARADEFNAHRKATQPPGATMGSMFKNPSGDYAGRLIDQAGLKGTRAGNAQISDVHANFFVNLGGATAADVKALIDRAQAEIARQFGVSLELEIELLGDWGG
jgi:UDP-N-acetylmuramate dehydrogenase